MIHVSCKLPYINTLPYACILRPEMELCMYRSDCVIETPPGCAPAPSRHQLRESSSRFFVSEHRPNFGFITSTPHNAPSPSQSVKGLLLWLTFPWICSPDSFLTDTRTVAESAAPSSTLRRVKGINPLRY